MHQEKENASWKTSISGVHKTWQLVRIKHERNRLMEIKYIQIQLPAHSVPQQFRRSDFLWRISCCREGLVRPRGNCFQTCDPTLRWLRRSLNSGTSALSSLASANSASPLTSATSPMIGWLYRRLYHWSWRNQRMSHAGIYRSHREWIFISQFAFQAPELWTFFLKSTSGVSGCLWERTTASSYVSKHSYNWIFWTLSA